MRVCAFDLLVLLFFVAPPITCIATCICPMKNSNTKFEGQEHEVLCEYQYYQCHV